MALPQDIEKRKRVATDLQRCINIMHEIDLLESDLDDLAQVLQDEDIMKAKEFKALVKAKYEGETLRIKAEDKLKQIEDDIANVEILNKVVK